MNTFFFQDPDGLTRPYRPDSQTRWPTDLPDLCLRAVTSREGNLSDSDSVRVKPFAWGSLDHATYTASLLLPVG